MCVTYTEEAFFQDHVPLRQVDVQIVIVHIGGIGDVVGQGVVLPHLAVNEQLFQPLVGDELVGEGLDADQFGQATTIQPRLRAHEQSDGVQRIGTDELQQISKWDDDNDKSICTALNLVR